MRATHPKFKIWEIVKTVCQTVSYLRIEQIMFVNDEYIYFTYQTMTVWYFRLREHEIDKLTKVEKWYFIYNSKND